MISDSESPGLEARSAALNLGGGVPCDAAAGGQRESVASGKNSAATGTGYLPFLGGECTERGRPVKALRFAPIAARRKECGLD